MKDDQDNFIPEQPYAPSKVASGISLSTSSSIKSLSARSRVSRDEMNLAEFPLTVLSTRSDPSLKTLEFKDAIKGRNGELLERKWIITGADKFGLPTASDDEVLLGLLKLSVDDGMKDRKVFFTRYELLRTLKWTTEGRSYSRLQKALDRLSGVRIKASNAFYDNETKVHSTRNFGIIDAYEINSGSDAHAKTSYFTWSETIYKSFQSGFIKKLDLDFYLDLQSAVSKRLYRYLDKHFWYKSRVQVDLFTLAHEKIGISRTYLYASSIRQILDPAIEELINQGFLEKVEYEGKGKGTYVSLYAGRQKPRVTESESMAKRAIDVITHNEPEDSLKSEVVHSLVTRGIKEAQVVRFVAGRSDEVLRRILQIVSYFDYLVASNSRLVSKSPIGFLYRAVETPENFILPSDTAKKPKQSEFNLENSTSSNTRNSFGRKAQTAEVSKTQSREIQLSKYVIERKQAIQEYRKNMEINELGMVTAEVETALKKLRDFITPSRFQEAVRHGVEEKIAKLANFPDFERWGIF